MGIELNGAQRRCNASTSNLMTLHEKCGSEPALHLSPRLNHLLTQPLPTPSTAQRCVFTPHDSTAALSSAIDTLNNTHMSCVTPYFVSVQRPKPCPLKPWLLTHMVRCACGLALCAACTMCC